MTWLKQNWHKVALLSFLIIGILLTAYYFIIFIPAQEQARVQREEAVDEIAGWETYQNE